MFVVATAGHVDHGKSALVRGLTGMEPDRWAEEQSRGMTIDLGFAWTTTPNGTHIAFVDVPGHQRFVTNMLAGVGPTPAVLLVVAADQGWRQQTAEHVAALDALGVSHGVLAITRADLADPAAALAQARAELSGTSLDGIEALPVSAVTRSGLPELADALQRMVAQLHPPKTSAVRLWIDRAFSAAGAGTIVTGTLQSGTIRTGDELLVAPAGLMVQVRSLQTLKETVSEASGVARVAVNLRRVRKTQLRRGYALVTPGRWFCSDLIDVVLCQPVESLPREATLHMGSAAVSSQIRPIGPHAARLQLRTRLPLHVGDRGVLRDPGSARILAGIVAVDVAPSPLGRRGAASRRAAEIEAISDIVDPFAEVRRRGVVRASQLVATGHLETTTTLSGVVAAGEWLVDASTWEGWRDRIQDVVERWEADHPLDPVMPLGAVVSAIGLPDKPLASRVASTVPVLVADATGLRRRDAVADLPPPLAEAIEILSQRLRQNPFAAPDVSELAALGLTDRYLALATKAGRLLRVAQGVYLLPDAVSESTHCLARIPQPFTTSEARMALNTSRRVAIPILELLDQLRITRRVDTSHRVLRPTGDIDADQ